jgi:hypothetical protein
MEALRLTAAAMLEEQMQEPTLAAETLVAAILAAETLAFSL